MVERGFDSRMNVRLRRDHARMFARPRDFRDDQRGEDADDRDDQQHFNEREAAQPLAFDFVWYDSVS